MASGPERWQLQTHPLVTDAELLLIKFELLLKVSPPERACERH